METERRELNLVCTLTDDEIGDRAFDVDQTDQAIQDLETEFENVKKEHKSMVGNHEARRRLLLREIRTRRTHRGVECEIEPIYHPAFVVRTTRLDTGEIVHERQMSEEEKQGQLIDLDEQSGDAAS